MADLSLRINANFEAAKKAFEDLGAVSAETRKKFDKFAEGFKAEQVDKFIEKQKVAGAAVTAVKGDIAGLQSQQAAYGREIERLIKSGLDPESEAIQKLIGEYSGLVSRQESMETSTRELAEAEAATAEALRKEGDIVTSQLDVKSKLEKENIRLKESQNAVKNEIKSLISQGYDPEGKEVKSLQDEYKKLSMEIENNGQAHKLNENASKYAAIALGALSAAVVAAGAFAIKAAADVEDMTASYTPLMGSAEKAAELVKRIQTEAAATPFEIGAISDSVKRLLPAFGGSADAAMKAFRMIGDTAQGNGQRLETITNAYTKAMMKGKVSMEELNMMSDAGVPIFSELAKSMGVTESELIKMSSSGKISADDLASAFETMTGEGGLFFEGMELSSKTFSSTLLGVKENIGNIAGAIGAEMLPTIKSIATAVYDTTRSFMDWISQGDNLKKLTGILSNVAIAVGILGAALVTLLVIDKISKAMAAFNIILSANPIGIIVLAVAALVAAIVLLWKNWDWVVTYIQQGAARIEYAVKWIGSQIKEKFITAVNGVKIAFMSLLDVIQSKVLGGVAKLLEVLGKIPFVGETFDNAARSVRGFSENISASIQNVKNESAAMIQAARAEQNETEAALKRKLDGIDREAAARRNQIEQQKKENAAAAEDEKNAAAAAQTEKDGLVGENAKAGQDKLKDILQKSLQERLAALGETEAQTRIEQQEQFAQFLAGRLEAENLEGEARITYLQEQHALLMEQAAINDGERIALERATNEAILAEKKKMYDDQIALMNTQVSATADFFNSVGEIAEASGKKSRGLAVAQKAVMTAQAVVQTYMAANAALANGGGVPWGLIPMAATIAAGLASVVKITSTPIPSAETGGSFMYHDSGPRVDGGVLRVNNNEQVDITPSAMTGSGGGTQTFNLVFNSDILATAINKLARNGDLYTLQLAGNL
ncbi:MAG: tape measure protein [Treponema sp.]|jgi:tape measure domain-containing protein|nr:tape measure protein [Treponema sp.]